MKILNALVAACILLLHLGADVRASVSEMRQTAPIMQGLGIPAEWVREARIRGGFAAVDPQNTCPQGTANAEYDGCEDASPLSLFKDPNLLDYYKDADGDPAVLAITPGQQSGKEFNVAGKDFPVGPRVTVFKDPALYYFATTGSTVNGATFTAGTVTVGTVRNGLILWSSPSSAGLLTNHPVLSNCTGGVTVSHPDGGGDGTTCTLSVSQSSKSGPYRGSHAPGCSFNVSVVTYSEWVCDSRLPNQALTLNFEGFEWGAVGGHNSTKLRILNRDNGIPTYVFRDNHFVVDANTEGQAMVGGNPALDINLVYEFNECDGGNSGVAVGASPGAFPFPDQSPCLSWGGSGTSGGRGNATTVTFRFNYIHDYAGNPIQLAYGYNDILSQGNLFYKIGMNNGDGTSGGKPTGNTGFHGASINWNTTEVGSEGWVRRFNDTVIYPFGFRFGVTTAPFAILCGVGSAGKIDYEQRFTTTIINSSVPGYATASQWINFLRCGAVTRFVAHDNYVSTVGIGGGGCFALGADANDSGFAGNVVLDSGTGRSTWTASGLQNVSEQALPYPGNLINTVQGSSVTQWKATLTDLLDGTSQMDIASTSVGSTTSLTVGAQVVSLRMADPKVHPTLIMSQIDSNSYVVRNGSGSGENLAEETFRIGQVLLDYGTDGTTASGGSPKTNSNGTWRTGGEWSRTGPMFTTATRPGNVATIDADVERNWDVLSGAEFTVDGPSLTQGYCPGTSSTATPP